MKFKKTVLCLSAILSISLIATGCGKEIEVKNGSKVAVSIKGNKYTATEYYEKIKEDNISRLVDMIDKDLFEKKYPKSDDENKEVEDQINQIKQYYGSDEETYKNVLLQYFGVETEKELEEKLRLEYKRSQAVKDYVLKSVKDDEIKKYYNENIYGKVKASHILIKSDAKSDATEEEKTKAEEEALKKAKEIIKKLDDGEDFAKLAKKNSDDKATSTNGGDLGFFSLDDMVEEFSNAVKELKKDEYTKEPVKTEYGYHIIIKKDEEDKPTLKSVKQEIKEKLRDQKLNDNNTLYYEALRDIRNENKIKWNDSELKKAYNEYVENLIKNSSN